LHSIKASQHLTSSVTYRTSCLLKSRRKTISRRLLKKIEKLLFGAVQWEEALGRRLTDKDWEGLAAKRGKSVKRGARAV